MKTILTSKRNQHMARVSTFLIMVALIAGTVSCGEVTPPVQYDLTMSVAPAGSGNATDLTNASPYAAGTVVNVTAVAAVGYEFVNWTAPAGTFANATAAQTIFTMPAHYTTVTANFAPKAAEIRTWYDLDAIRDNLSGNYLLVNDLDSTTAGYHELAGETANQGQGWEPIGTGAEPFTGVFRGQGYEIGDLSSYRPDQSEVGLFGFVADGGFIESVNVVDSVVAGGVAGGLAGANGGAIDDCYFRGSVSGGIVGGLAGTNNGTVDDCCFSGSVAGVFDGHAYFGGLVGFNHQGGTVSNSHYDYDEVLINGQNIITIGALFNEDFDRWLANDKSLDVNERLSQENGYYLINDISDFKQLLAFGQDDSLKFRLENNLDLATELNFYIPYLAGEFDGNGHRISNLNVNLYPFPSAVGLFGFLASGGEIGELAVENVNVTGWDAVGGLVGGNDGNVTDSYSTGSVTGNQEAGGLVGGNWQGTVSNSYSDSTVSGDNWGYGGLVGMNLGTVSNSYSTGSVTGPWVAGGLVGDNRGGSVVDSHYDYDEVLINGENVITIGALFHEDFEQWLANDKFLDVDERLCREDGYYLINNASDFKQLLAFGQDSSLKFRLKNDLDLSNEDNFYVPYLAGEFDGNGRKIANLSLNFDSLAYVGLFGYLAPSGRVTQVGAENVNVTGGDVVGGLVGGNWGNVNNSYASGSVTGLTYVGGLVGWNWGTVGSCYTSGSVVGGGEWGLVVGGLVGGNWGTVSDSYSISSVTGVDMVGGLMGVNRGTISNSYSVGSVTGSDRVGGLVGRNRGAVNNSFWDTHASGQSTSAGGTSKTTAEIKNIATFSGAGWNIIAVVNPSTRDASYIWNIVDGQTYPFLSWQS